jgi:hypothetical protein
VGNVKNESILVDLLNALLYRFTSALNTIWYNKTSKDSANIFFVHLSRHHSLVARRDRKKEKKKSTASAITQQQTSVIYPLDGGVDCVIIIVFFFEGTRDMVLFLAHLRVSCPSGRP